MYILINTVKYENIKYIKSSNEDIIFLGESIPADLTNLDVISLYRDDDFLLRDISVSDFDHTTVQEGALTLIKNPLPEPQPSEDNPTADEVLDVLLGVE